MEKNLSSQSDVELFENISIDKLEKNIEDLTAIYLTDSDTQTCHNLGENFGIVAINSTGLSHKEYLFKGDGFLLNKNKVCYKDQTRNRYSDDYGNVHWNEFSQRYFRFA